MNKFSALDREAYLQSIATTSYDLIVVGGGVTGAGIALDAASRGIKTLLLEKEDFASGTSSRSTKLIHGGLRYLKQLEFKLVYEVGRERAIVHRLARHLVHPEKMLLPILKQGTLGWWGTFLGLWVYDLLAGVEKKDRRKMLRKDQTSKAEPLLPADSLIGGCLYSEYRTDDARLTIELVKTAMLLGADCLNYAEVQKFLYEKGQICGVRFHNRMKEEILDIHAKYVINATGPWVDHLRVLDGSRQGKTLFLSKGVHIVLPYHRLPLRQSVYFDVPDGRMVFAIPRGQATYIGTTDTPFHHAPDRVAPDRGDVGYLIQAANSMFPTLKLTQEDVISSWAGLRPLIREERKNASEISRKDELFQSPTGLISIAGGKLTGYRRMAKKTVDQISRKLYKEHQQKTGNCRSRVIFLTGNSFEDEDAFRDYLHAVAGRIHSWGYTSDTARYLVHNYGDQTGVILDRVQGMKETDLSWRLLKAELEYCLHHEMCFKPLDFLNRRTGRLYFDVPAVQKYRGQVLAEFRRFFNWGEEVLQSETHLLEQALSEAMVLSPSGGMAESPVRSDHREKD